VQTQICEAPVSLADGKSSWDRQDPNRRKIRLRQAEFPDIFPETTGCFPAMSRRQKSSLSAYRHRQKRQGIVRLEVHVRKDDAALIRGVAHALSDPAREADTRALLRERFGAVKGKSLKALLAAAPLEGIDLTRRRDLGRDIKL
jgi:hypothetical protein